mgnify:CR=1 FL=1
MADRTVEPGEQLHVLRLRPHETEELAHYAKAATDVEYEFPFGWQELEGIANRTDFDLTTHSKHSGTDLVYFDQATGEKYTPYVIEPAAGLSRSLMTFLVDAYTEDEAPNTKTPRVIATARANLGNDTFSMEELKGALTPKDLNILGATFRQALKPDQKASYKQLATDEERRSWLLQFALNPQGVYL